MCIAKNASVEINLKFEKQLFTFTTYLEQVTTTATPAKKGANIIVTTVLKLLSLSRNSPSTKFHALLHPL